MYIFVTEYKIMKYNTTFCIGFIFLGCSPNNTNNKNSVINIDSYDSEKNIDICIKALKKNKNLENEIRKSFNETKNMILY